jgi:hypothetical protein
MEFFPFDNLPKEKYYIKFINLLTAFFPVLAMCWHTYYNGKDHSQKITFAFSYYIKNETESQSNVMTFITQLTETSEHGRDENGILLFDIINMCYRYSFIGKD